MVSEETPIQYDPSNIEKGTISDKFVFLYEVDKSGLVSKDIPAGTKADGEPYDAFTAVDLVWNGKQLHPGDPREREVRFGFTPTEREMVENNQPFNTRPYTDMGALVEALKRFDLNPMDHEAIEGSIVAIQAQTNRFGRREHRVLQVFGTAVDYDRDEAASYVDTQNAGAKQKAADF